jgi:hypothetical protein
LIALRLSWDAFWSLLPHAGTAITVHAPIPLTVGSH